MWAPEIEGEWARLSAQALAELGEWRAAHPRATLLEAAAVVGPEGDPALSARQTCPACGAAMAVEGRRALRLRTTHEREIALTRRYARCPACGTELFPPG